MLRKITNLFLVCFVASEQQAANNFASDLPAIITALQDELDEVGISAEKKAKLNGWLSKMLQLKFAGFLFVIADVHSVSAGVKTRAARGIKTVPRCARNQTPRCARSQSPRCARNQNKRRAARGIKVRAARGIKSYGPPGCYFSAVFRPGCDCVLK